MGKGTSHLAVDEFLLRAADTPTACAPVSLAAIIVITVDRMLCPL